MPRISRTKAEYDKIFTYKDGLLFREGEPTGTLTPSGYMSVSIHHYMYRTHRVIFMMHHGYLPTIVDHRDGDILNNRIGNLRAATHAQNAANCKLRKDNKSGVKGVCWHRVSGKWIVRIGKIYLGTFDDLELATLVVSEARDYIHGEFANHG